MKIKPGYKTSEFWFTFVSFLFSGLYLLGIIGDISQKEDLIRDVSHGVESIILIGGQLAILWKYINSRKEIKQTWWNAVGNEKEEAAEIVEIIEPIKPKRSKNGNSKRNSSARSRKTNSSSKKLAE
jgi:hypothetical protein